MAICVFKEQPPETLIHLEAFIEVHGQPVLWWGSTDSPNNDCRGIQIDQHHWLVLTPYLKGETEFIQILDAKEIGPDG